MKLSVDASVALEWFFADQPGEADVVQARSLLPAIASGHIELVQPPHWIVEIIAVVARRTPTLIAETVSTISGLTAHVVANDATYLRSAELAARLKQHVFDTLYHAVALERGAVLVTADERYFAAARGEGSIETLSNFRLT